MANTKISALPPITAVELTDQRAVDQSNVSKKETRAQSSDFLFKRIAGATGSAGEFKTLQRLTVNSADNTTVTPAVMMTTTNLGVGVWRFEYTLLYQSGATTNGIRMSINHTGTVGKFSMHSDFVSTGGTAATGVHDGTSSGATAGIHEGHAENALNTTSKATVGVSTANIDKLIIVRGLIEVTASGNLEFKMGSEVAGQASRLMASSSLELTKIG